MTHRGETRPDFAGPDVAVEGRDRERAVHVDGEHLAAAGEGRMAGVSETIAQTRSGGASMSISASARQPRSLAPTGQRTSSSVAPFTSGVHQEGEHA
jgi:hypothetical protein